MPNPVKWITNVGKSISYSFIDEMKELNPALNAFKEDNGDFVKSVKSTLSIKNLKDSGKSLNDNQYFKLARDTIDNLKDDLRTGKLYNREREKSAMDKAVADFIGFDDSLYFHAVCILLPEPYSSVSFGVGHEHGSVYKNSQCHYLSANVLHCMLRHMQNTAGTCRPSFAKNFNRTLLLYMD